jgi:hypothetical protein
LKRSHGFGCEERERKWRREEGDRQTKRANNEWKNDRKTDVAEM